jgi:hypothetical protein
MLSALTGIQADQEGKDVRMFKIYSEKRALGIYIDAWRKRKRERNLGGW